jgi:DNA-binding transcriptional MerR regulator
MQFSKLKTGMTAEKVRKYLEEHAHDIDPDVEYEAEVTEEQIQEAKEELSRTMIDLMVKEDEASHSASVFRA